jgi:hypothetical protein
MATMVAAHHLESFVAAVLLQVCNYACEILIKSCWLFLSYNTSIPHSFSSCRACVDLAQGVRNASCRLYLFCFQITRRRQIIANDCSNDFSSARPTDEFSASHCSSVLHCRTDPLCDQITAFRN